MRAITLLVALALAGCAGHPGPTRTDSAGPRTEWALVGPPSDGRGSAVWHAAIEHWETEAVYATAAECRHAQLEAETTLAPQLAQARAQRDAKELAILEPTGRWLSLSRCVERQVVPLVSQE